MSQDSSLDLEIEPTLRRASHSYVSSEATPTSCHSCTGCAINALKITHTEKELKQLKSSYEQKCMEFEEMESYYNYILDDKCKELSEIQNSLERILMNTTRSKSNSISISSQQRNSFSLNRIPSNNSIDINFLRPPSLTPEPSKATVTEASQAATYASSRNKNIAHNMVSARSLFSKQTHVNSNEIAWMKHLSRSTNNRMSMIPDSGILRQISSETEQSVDHDVFNCLYLQRIFDYLFQYKKKDRIHFDKIYNENITNILNDYHHVIYVHRDEYKEIYTILPQELKCNISKCKLFQFKNREMKQKYNPIISDIMDTIHVYICHSYHLGYRLMNNTSLKPNELSAKHDLISKIRGFNNPYFECHRFQTNVPQQIRRNKSKHNKSNAILSPKAMSVTAANRIRRNYAFGEKYYYWDEYKNNEMYIAPKANDLKCEIKDHYLSMEEYISIMNKAKELIKTKIALQTKVNVAKYRLQCNDALLLENIMVILIYCQYDKLCYDFCATFRRMTENETISSMKKRNSFYYWMSKLLRETVECYGTKIMDTKIKKYYHGTAHLIFDLFVVKLKAPISTTTSMDVATIFAGNDGIIVQFTEYSPHLTYFNCSWISPFSGEEERLFFSGCGALQIANIHLLKSKQNCEYYIKAIRNFHCFLRGSEIVNIEMDVDSEIEEKYKMQADDDDEVIITGLMDNYLNIMQNQFPVYINNVFAMFCKRRKEIYINMENIYEYYESFASIFWSDVDNLLRFDKMVKVFPNCVKITIICDFVSEEEEDEYDAQCYIDSLLVILRCINEMYENTQIDISIQTICIQKMKSKLCNMQFRFKLDEIGWKLNIEETFNLEEDDAVENWSLCRIKQEDAVIDKLTKLQLIK